MAIKSIGPSPEKLPNASIKVDIAKKAAFDFPNESGYIPLTE